MTPDQHTIAELQELAEHLRDKLADAESCCAAQRDWINATVENCSVFSDPPKVDCGSDYVPKSKLDHAEKCCAEMRSVIAWDCGCPWNAGGPNVHHSEQCTAKWNNAKEHALSSDCGKDYVSRRELRELLHKYARHHSQCVLRLVTAGSCTCGLDAVLKDEGK